MPPATFSTPEIKKAFYDEYNKKKRERYHNDPQYREEMLQKRREVYLKEKELGIGRYNPAIIEERKSKRNEHMMKINLEKRKEREKAREKAREEAVDLKISLLQSKLVANFTDYIGVDTHQMMNLLTESALAA
jgi:hypothetical protein